jgi:uncharacterized protein YgiM (DUF1202 family)
MRFSIELVQTLLNRVPSMNVRGLALPLFLFVLSAMIPVILAQESEEACSTRETVYPRSSTGIRDEASHRGQLVRYATPWQPLAVIGSHRQGPWCWLQVSDGWLIDSALLLSSTPRDTSNTRANSVIGSCYAGDKAYIKGPMNIRASATTESSVVGKANAGQFFHVSRSRQGANWCWLKVSVGWMANTSRVQSTKWTLSDAAAAYASRQTEQAPISDVDNCCFVDRECRSDAEWTDGYWALQTGQCTAGARSVTSTQPVGPWDSSERTLSRPIIEGSEWFVYGINNTLDLMQRSAPEWYNYVLNAADKIVESFNEAKYGSHASTVSTANGPIRWINYGAGALSCYQGSLCRVSVASILAHEACHIHQYWGGVPYTEPPCQKAARDAIASIRAGYSRAVR